jgi:hypothetical protein
MFSRSAGAPNVKGSFATSKMNGTFIAAPVFD